MGLSKGVLIHFQSHRRDLSTRKPVSANRVANWIKVIDQDWTEALGNGVNTSRAYMT